MTYYLHSNKGFTLIELMATLAILALIVVIAVPSIGTLIANADEKSEAASIAMIEKSGSIADVAGLEHDRDGEYDVATLIDNGYLDMDLSDDLVSATAYVQRTSDTGNTYEYYGAGDTVDITSDYITETPREYIDARLETLQPGLTFDDLGDAEKEALMASIEGGVVIKEYIGTDSNVVVPATIDGLQVMIIGEEAFRGKGLTSIELPDGLLEINDFAFMDNDLINIVIPGTVNMFNNGVLLNNPNMEWVLFENTPVGFYGPDYIGNPYSVSGEEETNFKVSVKRDARDIDVFEQVVTASTNFTFVLVD